MKVILTPMWNMHGEARFEWICPSCKSYSCGTKITKKHKCDICGESFTFVFNSASTRKTYWLNEVPTWGNKTGRKESQTEITEEEYNAYYEEWGGTDDPEVHCYNTDGTDNVSQYIMVVFESLDSTQ